MTVCNGADDEPDRTAVALLTRLTRLRYGPPVSAIVLSRPPIAGSTPSVPLPAARATASGTQMASTARIIAGHGVTTGRGRTTSASQSGTTTARTAATRLLSWAGLGVIAARPVRI